ncbi:hypothetical protein EIN_162260 [Entamoeba invadens IP1]|uniref:Uncharacterized protein n=1 Tax=Entamoeba invadens IP1 TaxID=370355 RepID=A0A0A1U1U9_ENTIV|nr:hypothetical protein EIN_162260 [Entamoeba invadens IP1]ELP86592.1 hypothetical protein EIN_162260 [Entamoeba invadens IP1]|eukprot:XP_004185938.1 hypothetical protein EIN_162260 [Entamoeba invadens IP1]
MVETCEDCMSNDSLSCSTCKSNTNKYYDKDMRTKCAMCTAIRYCNYCTFTSETCRECIDGAYLDNGHCFKCDNDQGKCIECTSDNKCAKCQSGYWVDTLTNTCVDHEPEVSSSTQTSSSDESFSLSEESNQSNQSNEDSESYSTTSDYSNNSNNSNYSDDSNNSSEEPYNNSSSSYTSSDQSGQSSYSNESSSLSEESNQSSEEPYNNSSSCDSSSDQSGQSSYSNQSSEEQSTSSESNSIGSDSNTTSSEQNSSESESQYPSEESTESSDSNNSSFDTSSSSNEKDTEYYLKAYYSDVACVSIQYEEVFPINRCIPFTTEDGTSIQYTRNIQEDKIILNVYNSSDCQNTTKTVDVELTDNCTDNSKTAVITQSEKEHLSFDSFIEFVVHKYIENTQTEVQTILYTKMDCENFQNKTNDNNSASYTTHVEMNVATFMQFEASDEQCKLPIKEFHCSCNTQYDNTTFVECNNNFLKRTYFVDKEATKLAFKEFFPIGKCVSQNCENTVYSGNSFMSENIDGKMTKKCFLGVKCQGEYFVTEQRNIVGNITKLGAGAFVEEFVSSIDINGMDDTIFSTKKFANEDELQILVIQQYTLLDDMVLSTHYKANVTEDVATLEIDNPVVGSGFGIKCGTVGDINVDNQSIRVECTH